MTGAEQRLVDACAVLDALRPLQGLAPLANGPVFEQAWAVALTRAAIVAEAYLQDLDWKH